jgi:hypothetical protein
MSFISGLDVGQQRDHTALVVVEREVIVAPHPQVPATVRHDVRHLHRWQLGTPYPAIIEDLQKWFRTPMLRGSTLVVDATGVGTGIALLLQQAHLMCLLAPVVITAGSLVGSDGRGAQTVPKKDLVFATTAALQTHRLRFADELPMRGELKAELESFRAKVTTERNEVYEAWRERDHDDLVLALALAVWYGERVGSGEYGTDYAAQDMPDIPSDTFR